MNSPTCIHYISHHQIDKTKWDNCISQATNSLIYGYSFYLDTMSKNWDALILNDYAAVFPLTWKKKYGISYLCQPAFTQQLGIFSQQTLSQNIQINFLTFCKKHFRFGEINLNFGNNVAQGTLRNNSILPLNRYFAEIQNNYSPSLLKILRQTAKKKLHYQVSQNFELAIHLFKKQYGNRVPHLKKEDYERLTILCKKLSQKENLLVREVYDNEKQLQSISVFFRDHNRIYLILSATPAVGRSNNAQHFLIDNLIQEFSTQPLLLDFEGSSIPSIDYFNSSFGCTNQPYPFVNWNQLPWPLNCLK